MKIYIIVAMRVTAIIFVEYLRSRAPVDLALEFRPLAPSRRTMDEIFETDCIERDLAQTQSRMDNRLDQLQDHLTPKQMPNDAFA